MIMSVGGGLCCRNSELIEPEVMFLLIPANPWWSYCSDRILLDVDFWCKQVTPPWTGIRRRRCHGCNIMLTITATANDTRLEVPLANVSTRPYQSFACFLGVHHHLAWDPRTDNLVDLAETLVPSSSHIITNTLPNWEFMCPSRLNCVVSCKPFLAQLTGNSRGRASRCHLFPEEIPR